jgi:hypothetical protein
MAIAIGITPLLLAEPDMAFHGDLRDRHGYSLGRPTPGCFVISAVVIGAFALMITRLAARVYFAYLDYGDRVLHGQGLPAVSSLIALAVSVLA